MRWFPLSVRILSFLFATAPLAALPAAAVPITYAFTATINDGFVLNGPGLPQTLTGSVVIDDTTLPSVSSATSATYTSFLSYEVIVNGVPLDFTGTSTTELIVCNGCIVNNQDQFRIRIGDNVATPRFRIGWDLPVGQFASTALPTTLPTTGDPADTLPGLVGPALFTLNTSDLMIGENSSNPLTVTASAGPPVPEPTAALIFGTALLLLRGASRR